MTNLFANRLHNNEYAKKKSSSTTACFENEDNTSSDEDDDNNARKKQKIYQKYTFSFIDFDFSTLSCGNQIKNLTGSSEGTISNMSPEIIFLSCSAIQTTENYNRCDVYSLAVVFIELLAHKTFKEITNDYGMKNIDKNNLIFATILFTGIPTVNELKKYINFIFDFTKKVDKEDDTEKNRSQCTRNMRYLKTVIEIVKEIESIVVDNDEEYHDRFKDDFGVAASIFFKGIAFDYLEKNIPNTGLQHLMKRMTVWVSIFLLCGKI